MQQLHGIPGPYDSAAIATLRERPWYRRPWGHYDLVRVQRNPRQEQHELVLDADDITVAFVSDSGGQLVSVGHVASSVLIGAGIGLAAWFGLRNSLKEIGDARRILARLHLEHRHIEKVMPKATATNPWQVKQRRTAEAMLLLNHTDRWEQRTRAIFSGGVVTAASVPEIYGYLGTPYLFGGLSHALVVSSTICLTVAVPLISVFAAGNACLQFHRAYRACRDRRLVPELAKQNPWSVEEFDSEKFVTERLKLERNVAFATGVSFSTIAAGVPLTFFVGGFGAAIIIPGILGVSVADHFEKKKIEYLNPMSFEEIHALVTERQINNAMGYAYQEYVLLKRLKHSKSADYLVGAHHGHLRRTLGGPFRMLQRQRGRARHSRVPPIASLYGFLQARLRIRQAYLQNEVGVFVKHFHEDDHALRSLLQAARQAQQATHSDLKCLSAEAAALPNLPPPVAMSRLCKTLCTDGLFGRYILLCAKDRTLREALQIGPHGVQLSAAALVAKVEAAGPGQRALCERLFCRAEHLFLTTLKDFRHSRARELADLAVERKRAKYVLERQDLRAAAHS